MATITTTTNGTPLQFPANTLIDRDGNTGYLYALVKASTSNVYELWRSINGGTTWAVFGTVTRASIQEVGSIYIDNSGFLHWVYRTNESSQDRIYYRRFAISTASWGGEVLTGNPGNGGVAGAVHTGMDLVVTVIGGVSRIAIAVGTQSGSNHGVTLYGVHINANGVATYFNTIVSGTRQWLHAGTGRITPSIDIEHVGDGKSRPQQAAHLWVCWGRTNVYTAKGAWTGDRWVGQTTAIKANPVTLAVAQNGITGRWNGQRFCIAVPDPSTTDRVQLIIRTVSNTTSSVHQSPAHPNGVVTQVTLSYNSVNSDIRVYAVGTSANTLYYIDFVFATNTWTTWTQVLATAIMSANQFSVRRSSLGARYDVYTAHSGSPNTLTHTQQSVAYAPNDPAWDTTAMGRPSGQAADVNAALTLDWIFSDVDAADAQTAYALSRQIGAGTVEYWRASDSTWQATEQKNTSASTFVRLPIAWGSGSDAATAFRAKVWDSADVASDYGLPYVVVPSVKVNPTLDSPADAATVAESVVTLAWTVSEQTAFRVELVPQSANMVLNPYFETNASNWSGVGGTVARSTAQFHQGAASLLLTPSGTDATVHARSSNMVATDGTRYVIRGWIRCAVARDVTLKFRFLDASSVALADPAGTAFKTQALAANTWTYFAHNAVAPANTAFVQHCVELTGTPAAGHLTYLDEAWLFDNGQVAHATGWIDRTDRTYAIPLSFSDNTTWMVQLDTRNNEGLGSDPDRADFTVDFVEPATPTLVATPVSASGWISVAITNPAPGGGQPVVADQDLYRRKVGDTDDGTRIAAGLPSGATHLDWRAVHGIAYQYRVHTRGSNGTAIFGAWTS